MPNLNVTQICEIYQILKPQYKKKKKWLCKIGPNAHGMFLHWHGDLRFA